MNAESTTFLARIDAPSGELNVRLARYNDGSTAVCVTTAEGEPYATLTTCLADVSASLHRGEVLINADEHNRPLLERLLQKGVLSPTSKVVRMSRDRSSHCYPIWRITNPA